LDAKPMTSPQLISQTFDLKTFQFVPTNHTLTQT